MLKVQTTRYYTCGIQKKKNKTEQRKNKGKAAEETWKFNSINHFPLNYRLSGDIIVLQAIVW